MADALILVGAISAAATVLAGGMLIGWGVRGLATASRCGCGHAFGMADKYDGHCTATVIETNFVGGVRRTRKRVACSCKAHRPAGMSAPDLTGSERGFVEVPQ
jgi:hypothetical protein